MSELFKKLDHNFKHILVHTGQHYDKLLSGVFFKDLKIRKPDFNLNIGSKNNSHYHQLSNLNVAFLNLLNRKKINPDLIIFLGDSNSVGLSFVLKKEGYKIAHIEAGMRSYDKRMLEEINRTVCDHVSDYLFVYHKDYKTNLKRENIVKNVYVVGNTIVEPCKKILKSIRANKMNQKFILVDIHRPENFLYKKRLVNIMKYLNSCKKKFGYEIYFLKFKRTMKYLNNIKFNKSYIKFINLQSYKNFIIMQKQAEFIVSDSGTAQEEPAIFKKPVIVPRDFTERPQSFRANCSFMINVNKKNNSWQNSFEWLDKIFLKKIKSSSRWLGNGKASDNIIKILKKKL
jgi:UDP-N-acetylglucosamine 2-epimerase (non-hydrolysing)